MKTFTFLVLLLISPLLNAATIDILPQPYEITALKLYNVNRSISNIDWTGSTLNFTSFDGGVINWKINGIPWLTREFAVKPVSENVIQLFTEFPATIANSLWTGIFNKDFSQLNGRLDGLGRSDMTGFWSMEQTAPPIELPAALVLFLSSLFSVFFFARLETR